MALIPYFLLSPNSVMSLIGLLKGPDKTVPTPAEDWRDATVNVVIPTFNEEENIIECIASITKQTLRPKRIIIIDDGSSDNTLELIGKFCTSTGDNSLSNGYKYSISGIEVVLIPRAKPIGKTPTIKRQSREYIADVEFVLDSDTVLESENYIERTVFELYQAIGIASACGVILPKREKDHRNYRNNPLIKGFFEKNDPDLIPKRKSILSRISQSITNAYRGSLYVFLQKFIYRGQMVFFGSITNPVGCAVAYRQKYVKDLFDKYEPIMGDDLTNSEDIFIGFAMINKGYRNIQLSDVIARTQEPKIGRLPRQVYLWSSSYYQCCYYFNDLILTPFRLFRNIARKWRDRKFAQEIQSRRKIQEPYRQRFGDDFSKRFGRPMGWIIFTGALEKIIFPVTLLLFVILGWWWALLITLCVESAFSLFVMLIISKGNRAKYVFISFMTIPIRYSVLLWDFFTMTKFGIDLWIRRTRKWRK